VRIGTVGVTGGADWPWLNRCLDQHRAAELRRLRSAEIETRSTIGA
jgi:hypothetical protein